MKLAIVVQRYGAKINGGAELHARYIAELLARHHKVDALTTRASDYVTWRDELPEGTETLRGVTIRRFSVSRERDPRQFGHHSRHVFEHRHSPADELSWLESEGPTSPAMIEYIRTHADDYDFWIFFSYRYYHAYHGARAVPHKAILVPTAERDPSIGLSLFGSLFRGVRAVMYNSHEERAMIRAATKNDDVPGVVVGVGSDVPRSTSPERFRKKFDVQGPFIVYVGRIDENKGCNELFSFFTGYRPSLGQRLQLVLIGNSILPIPKHPNIRHLGYVTDQDKFDAIAASDALVMPSYYESLSMVALEAWALGRPVLANGHCDVLRGQCIRSRAGLYYENFQEFCETLFTLTTHRELNLSLGDNGRRFFQQHYAWPVIERKYLDMLTRLAQDDASGRAPKGGMEPLPGWFARHRRTLPPAMSVLEGIPRGAATNESWGDEGLPSSGSLASATSARTFAGGDLARGSSSATSTTSGTWPASGERSGASSTSRAESRFGRDARETRDARGARIDRGSRDARDARDAQTGGRARSDRDRDGRRTTESAESRGSRDARRAPEPGNARRTRDARDNREARDVSASADVSRDAREPRESGEAQDGQSSRDRDRRRNRRRRAPGSREPRSDRDAQARDDRDPQGSSDTRDARPFRGSTDAGSDSSSSNADDDRGNVAPADRAAGSGRPRRRRHHRSGPRGDRS